MSIHILTGLPGSGKTYVLVRKALEFLDRDIPVYSNFLLNVPEDKKYLVHYYNKMSDLINLERGVVLMDEAQIYFNSRKWETLDERLQYKFQQHRKDGLDIWGTVQDIRRLDVIVRELVSHYYECSKLIASDEFSVKPWGIIRVTRYEVRDHDKIRRRFLSREWFLIKKKYVDSYNTLEKVVPLVDDFKKKRIRDASMILEARDGRKSLKNMRDLDTKRNKKRKYKKRRKKR